MKKGKDESEAMFDFLFGKNEFNKNCSPQPIKLFEEYPQGDLPKNDIYEKDSFLRKLNRKSNSAFNLYFQLYEQIKINYPESYKNGSIEADTIISIAAHFVTAIIRDIVESGVYHADDALNVFYENLAKNYEYLVEHSKLEKDIKLYGALKIIRLRKL